VWRSAVLLLVLAGAVGSACSNAAPSSEPRSTSSPATSASERVTLPESFPVLPGASPLALADDDPGLIAAWSSGQLYSAAYDFYRESLPGAGYPIVGGYPGDSVAIIRFRTVASGIWQMVVQTDGDVARIEIRLDRP
jgi:hypothetical protein